MNTEQQQNVVEDELLLENKQVGNTFYFLPEYKNYLKIDGDLIHDLNETFQLVVNEEKEMMKLTESFLGTSCEKCSINILQIDDYTINIEDWNGFQTLLIRLFPSECPFSEEKYRDFTEKLVSFFYASLTSRNQRFIESVFLDYYGKISLDKIYGLPVSFLIFNLVEFIKINNGKLIDYIDEKECNKDKFANMNFYDREPLVFLSKSNIVKHLFLKTLIKERCISTKNFIHIKLKYPTKWLERDVIPRLYEIMSEFGTVINVRSHYPTFAYVYFSDSNGMSSALKSGKNFTDFTIHYIPLDFREDEAKYIERFYNKSDFREKIKPNTPVIQTQNVTEQKVKMSVIQKQNSTVKKVKKKKYIDNRSYLNKMAINKTSNKSLGRIVRVYNYVFVTHTNIVLKRLTENIEWVLK
jgi:hypothetical protein